VALRGPFIANDMMTPGFKRQLRQAVRRFGYEVVPSGDVEGHAFVRHLSALFRKLDIRCVLDVGANRGQYRRLLRERVGYDGRIISFEPQSRNVAHLREEARADPCWEIRGHALGSADTRLDLNVMRADLLSSFLDPDPAMVPMFRDVNVVDRRETVDVWRLDSVRDALGSLENVFLKLDTQGFDLEVIRGAQATLPTVRALQTELSMQPLYRNAPSYREALDALTALGFAVTAMAPVSRDDRLRVIEFDCVMVNSRAATG
jgi:FkbM family methyltransferase